MAAKKPAPKKVRKKMGRPRKEINWKQFRKLCEIQCTLEEIAALFDCSIDTIENAVKREHAMTFSELHKIWGADGKKSLRRKQYELAMKGDRTMLIWLGKQWLGQSDKSEVGGKDGQPLVSRDNVVIILPDNGRDGPEEGPGA